MFALTLKKSTCTNSRDNNVIYLNDENDKKFEEIYE